MRSKYSIFILILLVLFTYLFIRVPATAAGCDNVKPGEPLLTTAVAGDKSVMLTWIEPPENVTYYLIQYGLEKENLTWGIPNIGGQGTTSFTINDLENGQKYYFQVRAGNGCKPGSFSNTLAAKAGINSTYSKTPKLSIRKQVLGEATASAKPKNDNGQPVKAIAAVDTKNSNCAFTCNSLPILAGELVALVGFFFLAHKLHFIKPIYSVLIPLGSIILYYQIHGVCNPYNFFCRYFLPLTIAIYLLILVPQKFSLLFRHSETKIIS